MISKTASTWGNGAITLPKKWRERHPTKHFLIEENTAGYLVIKPIVDVEYHEGKDGSYGLRFPQKMDPATFLTLMDDVEQKIQSERKTKKRSPKQ